MLKDKDLYASLKYDGYAILDGIPLKSLDDCFFSIEDKFEGLKHKISNNNNKIIDVDFHSTFLDHHKEYKQYVFEMISNLFRASVAEKLEPYKLIQANLFNKSKGKGFIVPHQNLTTVDESISASYSIWVPLNDTNSENGTIHLTPKSHNKFEKYRNYNKHWSPLYASSEINDYAMIPINLKKGQVLIFNDSLVHASPINRSDLNRIVFHGIITPLHSDIIYCKFNNNEVDLIKVSDDFWRTFTPGDDEPTAPLIKSIPFKEVKYTKESILREIAI